MSVIGQRSQEIVGATMNSTFKYIDHALYSEFMSQLEPDVTIKVGGPIGEFFFPSPLLVNPTKAPDNH